MMWISDWPSNPRPSSFVALLVTALMVIGLGCERRVPVPTQNYNQDQNDAGFDAGDVYECPEDCGPRGVCEGGECVCQQGAVECDEKCVSTETNPQHCGACDQTCPDQEFCSAGECVESCPGEATECDRSCVDLESSDLHCGECGNQCSTDIEGAVSGCDAGQCQMACFLENEVLCNENDGCVNLDEDDRHCGECGEVCESGEICSQGECVCGSGAESCGGECVDVDTDVDHCGECGNECVTAIDDLTAVCSGGTCIDECDPDVDDPVCIEQAFDFEDLKPNIYLPVNKTGSTGFTTVDGDSHLEIMLDGLDLVAEQLHDDVRFGVGHYPKDETTDCVADHDLDVGIYSQNQLQSVWSDFESEGLTPMDLMFEDIRDQERLTDFDDPMDNDRQKAVVMLTDPISEPNCAGDFDDLLAVVEDLEDDGILTYVISVEDDYYSEYDDIAETGGTTEANVAFDADQIASTFDDIGDELGAGQDGDEFDDCSVELEEGPLSADNLWVETENGLLDPDDYDYDAASWTVTIEEPICSDLEDPGTEPNSLVVQMGCESACDL